MHNLVAYNVGWLLYTLALGVVHHEGRGTMAAAMVHWCAECVLPSFHLGKACLDVSYPKSNQQPTTYPPNYLHK